VLKDNLSNTIKDPSKFTIKTPPIANGNVSANSLFDGTTDIDLLNNSSINSLPPGSNVSISFVINVNSDTAKTISNSAYGSAIGSNNVIISDTSNQGSDPDLDKNDICNETTDNIPTVLTSPEEGFFVPQAFTPNGDDIHDLFVINGLPELGTPSIKIYNRWGNKVYENSNYANNWDGTSNVSGALGSNKLPQGTYFYVIEITGIKTPFTKKGFIVLQY
jgi:gliding motility-associated-like protein